MSSAKVDFSDRMLSLGLARVSEAAAIASADLVGRGDEKAADQAAVNAMREQLNILDIAGVVVIGEGERDEAPMLFIGEEVGTQAVREPRLVGLRQIEVVAEQAVVRVKQVVDDAVDLHVLRDVVGRVQIDRGVQDKVLRPGSFGAT